MSQYDPVWSYGTVKMVLSSGETVDEDDPTWSYGESIIRHEYVEQVKSRSKNGLLLGVW